MQFRDVVIGKVIVSLSDGELWSCSWLPLQTGIEPQFILFFDCPEEEMERRLLGRNQVLGWHMSLGPGIQ